MAEQNNDQAQVQNEVQPADQQEAQQVQQDKDLQKRLRWAKQHKPDVYNEISNDAELSHAEIVIMLDDAEVPQADEIQDDEQDPTDEVDAGTTEGQPTGESTRPDEPQRDAGDDADVSGETVEDDSSTGTEPPATESIGTDPSAEEDKRDLEAEQQTDEVEPEQDNAQGTSANDQQNGAEPAIPADQAAHRDSEQTEEDAQDETDRNREAQELVGVENADQKAPEDGSVSDAGTPVADEPTTDAPNAAPAAVSQPDADTTATSTMDEPTDEKKDIQNADQGADYYPPSDDPTTQPAKEPVVGNPEETPTTDPHAVDTTQTTETAGTDPVAESSAYSVDGQPEEPVPGSDVVESDDSESHAEQANHGELSLGGDETSEDSVSDDVGDPQATTPVDGKINAPIEGASEAQANQPTPTDDRTPAEVDQKPMAKDKEPTEQPQTPGDQATGTSDGVNSVTSPEATDLVTAKTGKSTDPSTMLQLDTSAQANDFVASDEDDVRNNTSAPSPSDVLGEKANTSASIDKQQGSVPVQRLSDTLDTYTSEMATNKTHSDTDGANLQRQLYRAIQNVIYTKETADFVAGMNLLLDTIDEHRSGVFSDRHAFRFWPAINMPQAERLEFEHLMRLFLNMGPKEGRKESLKHTDVNAALQYTRDPEIKERLHQYINKVTG